jgi:hypothetical protein
LVEVVPSGFTLAGVFLTGVDFAGVAVEEVALAVADDAVVVVVVVVFFTGAELTALADLDCAALVAGFLRIGSGLVVPRGVRVRAGFEASLIDVLPAVTGVFFTGVVVDTGLLAEAVVPGFFAGVEVVPEVAFIGAAGVFAEVAADVPAAFSFLGTLFTGAAADPVISVTVAAGFFTGGTLAAVVADFAGVALDPATLEMFPTLAERELACILCNVYWLTLECSILLLDLV